MNKQMLIKTVEMAKNGDKTALENLYNDFHDKLYFFVLKNVKNKEAAKDITQETFLKSIEKLSSLEKPETYGVWLHSIAFNKCKDYFRDEQHIASFETDEEYETAMEDVHLNEPIMLPDDYAVNKERQKQLKDIIDELKPDMKSAVILYYYDNLSISEVAETLGINENSAKQKLFQARKKMKQKIDKLAQKGVMLSAVPIGAMLENTITSKYATACVKSTGAAYSSAITTKIAGISAAVVIAVGIPVGLSVFGKSKEYKPESTGYNNSNYAVSNYNSKSKNTDESHFTLSDSSTAEVLDSINSSDSTNTTENSSQISDNNVYAANANAASQQENSDVNQQTELSLSENSDTTSSEKAEIIQSLTAEKLLSMTVNEALELSDNNFEMIYPTFVQSGLQDVYKCSSFPAYGFKAYESDGFTTNPNKKINVLNLYSNAKINDEIYVGMTYNQLSEVLGETPKVFLCNCDVNIYSPVIIDGREWFIGYDLTQEQEDEIFARIKALAPDKDIFDLISNEYGIVISDMNPTIKVAAYDEINYQDR